MQNCFSRKRGSGPRAVGFRSASLILTTEALVSEFPEKEEKSTGSGGPPGGGVGGGMY